MGRRRATSKTLLDFSLLEEAGSHLGCHLCNERACAYKHPQLDSSSRTRCLSTFPVCCTPRPLTVLCLQLLLACVSKWWSLAIVFRLALSFTFCCFWPSEFPGGRYTIVAPNRVECGILATVFPFLGVTSSKPTSASASFAGREEALLHKAELPSFPLAPQRPRKNSCMLFSLVQ